jgi:hypothetical protein
MHLTEVYPLPTRTLHTTGPGNVEGLAEEEAGR